ncbi:hypothetical protein [Empedobacter falsenii]|uniref:Response regulator n=1 Tax=Empedobacter falsenii TaxID=343874 RepID=A0AAW7DI52_9FLAO|nr:hypothetical protein [Empedobacter falsenii]MDM1551649.1 hypothetical protein [Empedobacter falsenii]
MRKILIIEDTSKEKEYFDALINNNPNVVCTDDISSIYEIKTREFKEDLDFEYVYMHKSFSQAGVSDEIVSHIENYVNNTFSFRFITFSGGDYDTFYPKNGVYTAFINRNIFKNNLSQFLDFSKVINEWYLPALYFDDYKLRYLKSNISKVESSLNFEVITRCKNVLGYTDVDVTEDNNKLIIEKIKEYING